MTFELCPRCHGSGVIVLRRHATDIAVCPQCHGGCLVAFAMNVDVHTGTPPKVVRRRPGCTDRIPGAPRKISLSSPGRPQGAHAAVAS